MRKAQLKFQAATETCYTVLLWQVLGWMYSNAGEPFISEACIYEGSTFVLAGPSSVEDTCCHCTLKESCDECFL